MRPTNKTPQQNNFLESLKKYWFVVLAFLLAIPYLIRYYKNQAVNDIVNNVVQDEKEIVAQNQNPTTQLAGLHKITSRVDLHEIARNVAYNLGTSIRTKEVSWTDPAYWNPKGWTENDEKAYNQLAKINYVSSRDLVAKCYYFLTRRDLFKDVRELLDEEYRAKLKLFK
jgi:hypothetical protein